MGYEKQSMSEKIIFIQNLPADFFSKSLKSKGRQQWIKNLRQKVFICCYLPYLQFIATVTSNKLIVIVCREHVGRVL
jgi:hypothetical protein